MLKSKAWTYRNLRMPQAFRVVFVVAFDMVPRADFWRNRDQMIMTPKKTGQPEIILTNVPTSPVRNSNMQTRDVEFGLLFVNLGFFMCHI